MINFTPQEQLRILNIGALEYNIQSLKGIKNRNKGKDEFFKYDLDIFKQESKLADLTGNLEPKKLLEEIIYLSRDN